jgi:hypothetical protein
LARRNCVDLSRRLRRSVAALRQERPRDDATATEPIAMTRAATTIDRFVISILPRGHNSSTDANYLKYSFHALRFD